MKAARFEYARPLSCAEAVGLLQQNAGRAKVVSGGQSLGAMMNLRLAQPELLVDIRAIDVLRGCEVAAEMVTLGATTTHATIEDGRVSDPTRGLMRQVAGGIAYRAVRNRGTFGGSLAHADPAADWVNLMALLDAQYVLQGPSGVRTVATPDWMTGAFTTALREDEILTAVRIPRLSVSARWSYYKVNRKAGEFAQALAGIVDDPARARRRALIGAIDGAPYVFDAGPLIDLWSDAAADVELHRAGLKAGTYEYQIHLTALARAIADSRAMGRAAA